MIIRPPREAYSLLLQVTTGCSHNKWTTFCGTYRQKKFKIKSLEQIKKDLKEAHHCEDVDRVFLCDGDVLIIPHARPKEIFEANNKNLPDTERIGTYANAKSIL